MSKNTEPSTYAIGCEEGVQILQIQPFYKSALVNTDTYRAAGAKKILRLQACTEKEVPRSPCSHLKTYCPEALFCNVIINIDLVFGARHFGSFNFYGFKIPQSLKSYFGLFNEQA